MAKKMPYSSVFHEVCQFLFFRQWMALKAYANAEGIRIIGDIPIYVSMDSSDVLDHPDLFQLEAVDSSGKERSAGEKRDASSGKKEAAYRPKAVAGCPPDAFAENGQLWGNPLYDWEKQEETGYRWWIARLRHCFTLYDIVRVDHFRGFDEYYSIPYGDENAKRGHWEKGPGMKLFHAVQEALGKKEVIAEDLGYVTESVKELVKDSGYPGMKVLEFAFDSRDTGSANAYLPHNYTRNSVVYTGTHDNETVMGWLDDITEKEYDMVLAYFNLKKSDKKTEVCDALIRAAMGSVSDTCIIPIQDYLHYDHRYRMNTPSTIGKNWMFRLTENEIDENTWKNIKYLTELYGRG